MAVKVICAPETESEIADACAWYERHRAGLGAEFLGCVDSCVEVIGRSPEKYACVYKSCRRSLIRRFPYADISEYTDEIVTIYAVFHTARDPEKWRERLP
jgi:hypothetical protein